MQELNEFFSDKVWLMGLGHPLPSRSSGETQCLPGGAQVGDGL